MCACACVCVCVCVCVSDIHYARAMPNCHVEKKHQSEGGQNYDAQTWTHTLPIIGYVDGHIATGGLIVGNHLQEIRVHSAHVKVVPGIDVLNRNRVRAVWVFACFFTPFHD